MNYQSVADTAKSWNVSERTVRNYCATGKIPGAVLIGKTWNIPQDAERPERVNKKQPAPRTLLNILQDEMAVSGGFCSSRSACGTILFRSLLRTISKCFTTVASTNGNRNEVICWIPA